MSEAKKFKLPGLKGVYTEAKKRHEHTIAFELINGKGRFLFMMFFDAEEASSYDKIYIFMKNTQKMLQVKMWGFPENGSSHIYLHKSEIKLFREELLLDSSNSGSPFDVELFFNAINGSIPKSLPLQNKINTLRGSWDDIKNHLPKDVIEDSNKTTLLGPKRLPPNQRPRERTLRKLYLYADSNVSDIVNLIEKLKKMNHTVAWTADPDKPTKSVTSVFAEF